MLVEKHSRLTSSRNLKETHCSFVITRVTQFSSNGVEVTMFWSSCPEQTSWISHMRMCRTTLCTLSVTVLSCPSMQNLHGASTPSSSTTSTKMPASTERTKSAMSSRSLFISCSLCSSVKQSCAGEAPSEDSLLQTAKSCGAGNGWRRGPAPAASSARRLAATYAMPLKPGTSSSLVLGLDCTTFSASPISLSQQQLPKRKGQSIAKALQQPASHAQCL
mmetsp:Transcript_88906/g.206898  ORF Transcript_88906/g.206898 Transcript_88906/m.206898 type:complete len:219 (-) Transcript_88906:29-685(-)